MQILEHKLEESLVSFRFSKDALTDEEKNDRTSLKLKTYK